MFRCLDFDVTHTVITGFFFHDSKGWTVLNYRVYTMLLQDVAKETLFHSSEVPSTLSRFLL